MTYLTYTYICSCVRVGASYDISDIYMSYMAYVYHICSMRHTNKIWHIHEWVMSCTHKHTEIHINTHQHTETHMNTQKHTCKAPARDMVSLYT